MTKVKLPVTLVGTITKYKGNGRKLGYPTANIGTKTDLPDGVYFGYADMGMYTHHPAVIFVGTPTTVGDTERRVEAHLFDIVDKDYYDQELRLHMEYYHRRNQTFTSVGKLQEVMQADEVTARNWFAKNSKKQDN